METTKAQQFIEIAKWVKSQNPLFTRHFKSMNSIIRVYKVLPVDYDKTKSVKEYIRKNKGRQGADKLALIINAEFGFRYFEDATKRYILSFGLRRYTYRSGKEQIEVYCDRYDRCNVRDDYKPMEYGRMTVSIKTLGDAKRAAEHLLTSATERLADDYEVTYGDKLKAAMKESAPTDEVLTEGIEVRI